MENKKKKKKFEPKMESVDKAMSMVSMGSLGKAAKGLSSALKSKGKDTVELLNKKRGDMSASQQSESRARQEVLKKLKENPSFFDNLDPRIKKLADKVISGYKK